jgi:hypothetical protein
MSGCSLEPYRGRITRMGGHPWWYVVDYEEPSRALNRLRQREFQAGRYNPAIPFPPFPITATSPTPGPKHATIDAAREAAAEDGTRSILDIDAIAAEPDYGVAAPLEPEILVDIYETDQPTLEMIEDSEFLEAIDERGQGRYFTVYESGRPRYLVFAGYSFD